MPLRSWLTRLYRQFASPRFLAKSARRSRLQLSTAIIESLEHRRLLSGTTITVDLLGDTEVQFRTTLRDAITAANTQAGGGDIIKFDPSLTGTITLTQGVLPITNAMSIVGPSNGSLAISANAQSQVFNVSSSTNVTINLLTLTGGSGSDGGAVVNTGKLTLSKDVFSGNTATGNGGAVKNDGILTLSNDTFTNNLATNGGGVYNSQTGTVTGISDTFIGNHASGNGGGLANLGTLSSIKDLFTQNLAASGGGVENDAIGIVTLTNSTVSDNLATDHGGGLANFGTLTASTDTISGNQAASGGGAYNDASGTFTTSNSTYSGNVGSGTGGGVETLGTLASTNDTYANNSAVNGGGIFNSGTLTTTDVTVAGNTGSGIDHQSLWTTLNSIVAGNVVSGGSGTPSDVVNTGSTINATSTLIGDASSAGGITATNGNIVGSPVNALFVTDSNGMPLLANNSGPTQTIALLPGSPAIGPSSALAALTGSIGPANVSTIIPVTSTTFIAAGDLLRIDKEFVLVTSVGDATHVTVNRGQKGTTAISHATNAPVTLAVDQRGFVRSQSEIGAVTTPRTITVTVGGDTEINGQMTLRDAINAADLESPGDVIVFDPSVTGSVTLTHGVLPITNAMTINGPGAGVLAISGNYQSQIFLVSSTSNTQFAVTISGLTLTRGHGGPGGALSNSQTLTLLNDTFGGNTGTFGGVCIWNSGTLSSTGSTFRDNTVVGVVVYNTGTLTSTGDTFLDNANEGAIYNVGTTTTTNDQFVHNTQPHNGTSTAGAILNNGTLTSTHDTFTANTAGIGGAIYNLKTMSISHDTFSNNLSTSANGGGGAIYNSSAGILTSADDTFIGNQAVGSNSNGGAIQNLGMVFIVNDTFSNNMASTRGGAIYNQSGSVSSSGSTFSGNSAAVGGGLFISAKFTSTNETFVGNTATNAGGAAYSNAGIKAINDTISGNTAVLGGGVYGALIAFNSIVVGNTGGDFTALPNSGSASVQGSHNLTSLPSGKTLADVLVTVPNSNPLQPMLANNGGMTQTVALAPGSLAAGRGAALSSVLDAVASTTASTKIVVAPTPFFAVGQLLRIDSELVLVTAVPADYMNSNNITVQRAQNGTTAAAHQVGASIFLAFDATGAPRVNIDLGAVAEVNHAPVGTSGTVIGGVNAPYTLKIADFGLTDPNDTPANSLLAVKFTLLPTAGMLTDNGIAVAAGQFVSATDIAAGKLVFTPSANLKGIVFLSKFQVEDNGGTANGGADFDQTAKVLYIKLIVPNHAPVGTSGTVTAAVGAPYTLKAADFGFSDSNDTPQNALLAVKFILLPTAGTLADNDTAVTAGQFVSAADINSGKLVFTPTVTGKGLFFLSKFQVEDNGGTAAGGVDLDPTAKVLYINLVTVNHAPTGTSGTVNSSAGTPYTFKTADFGFTDPSDSPSNSLLAVKITLLPTAGTLTDNGTAVTAGQIIATADISTGQFVFTPTSTGKGVFFLCKFQVEDNGGTANGGADLDPAAKVLDLKLS